MAEDGAETAAPSGAPAPGGARPAAAPLEVRGLTKHFTGTLALDRVDFEVRRGEVHALLGENGAGKSTLIKILAGIHVPDGGEIVVHGRPVRPWHERVPISFIHQDLGLVDSMTIAENVALVAGYPRGRGRLVSWRATRARARSLLHVLEEEGAGLDPGAQVSALAAAERSLVAIARALATDADVLVLDEPTATLPEADVARLFDVLRRLRSNGMGIVYVSHRLDEVFRLADRVTVLRDGRHISTRTVAQTTPRELIHDIVGRRLEEVFVEPGRPRPAQALELDGVVVGGVGPVSLRVAAGEILGLVGLRGAGQQEVGRAVFGDLRADAGAIRVAGRDVVPATPRDALAAGIGFVSSKRGEESLVGGLTVRENLFPNPRLVDERGLLGRRRERARAARVLDAFGVRPRDPERPASTLSGGNQQKVILARLLEIGGSLLVLEEPTFGVDVGAKAEIYATMRRTVDAGIAILLISSDFEEVAFLCNRALIFNRGGIVAEVPRTELSVARLTELASGVAG